MTSTNTGKFLQHFVDLERECSYPLRGIILVPTWDPKGGATEVDAVRQTAREILQESLIESSVWNESRRMWMFREVSLMIREFLVVSELNVLHGHEFNFVHIAPVPSNPNSVIHQRSCTAALFMWPMLRSPHEGAPLELTMELVP